VEEVGAPALKKDGHADDAATHSGGGAKKVLIHYPVFNRGGAEKSLLRLMAGLAQRGHEVHLVLTSAGGALEAEVDPRVRIHHLRSVRTWDIGAAGRGPRALAAPMRGMRWMIGRAQEFSRRRRFRAMTFDAAFTGIAGLSPDFICNVVRARKRFVFVRNDPAVDRRGRWAERIRDFHDRIDGYVCVSRFVEQAMGSRFPEIAGKLVTVYNLLDAESMRTKATTGGDPFPEAGGVLRIVSVCRLLESQKALLRMVEVHRRLLEAGFAHAWHVLGDGPDRGLLEHAIGDHGVAGTFILHGDVANPFPYYKHADICAVLSRYEGLCGVVNEARVLERPVIATRFSGIEEQIEHGVNGLIVEQDVESICDGMASLIRDVEIRKRLAVGGYPVALLDDGLKLDALLELIAGKSSVVAGIQ
jgi:glycosyltransferase involved in cell wall biosynthesis